MLTNKHESTYDRVPHNVTHLYSFADELPIGKLAVSPHYIAQSSNRSTSSDGRHMGSHQRTSRKLMFQITQIMDHKKYLGKWSLLITINHL